ncbi:MAG TPA: histidine kinase dimerization/phospho-acceptor domain-containing protein [Thermoanaerobaculia bacterium]
MTSDETDRAEDRRLAAHMRAVAAITPAVAHDLRAPINSMVFNLEILKETITGSLASDPKARERQARYLRVLREELSRLHRGIEIWLAQTAERSPEPESVDLGELVGELAALLVAPARKRQVQVDFEGPDEPATILGVRHLLKQALLLVGLAALEGAAGGTTLTLRLTHGDGQLCVTIGGEPIAPPHAGLEAPAAAEEDPAALEVAAALLAASGGELRRHGPADRPTAYELEWPASTR